tara:strand:- start:21717 stop:23057 length:1341 start_codon:yes stop_codon:yes gene_type:complete
MLSIDKLLLKGFVVGSKEMTKDTTSDSDLDFGWDISEQNANPDAHEVDVHNLTYRVASDLRNLILHSVENYGPINADNLMSQYWGEVNKNNWANKLLGVDSLLGDFPPLISPFPWTWIEGSPPPDTQKALFGETSRRKRIRWSMFYQTVPLENGVVELQCGKPYFCHQPFQYWDNPVDRLSGEETEASWLATAILMMDFGKGTQFVTGPLASMSFFLDDKGHFMAEETDRLATTLEWRMHDETGAVDDGDGLSLHVRTGDEGTKVIGGYDEAQRLNKEKISLRLFGNDKRVIYNRFLSANPEFVLGGGDFDELGHTRFDKVLVSGVKSLLWSIGFLNCSNVGTVVVKNNSKKKNKKYKKKHGHEPLSYRVVTVSPHLSTVYEHSNEVKNTKDLPLHVVRGHFRKYTEERPLFGRYSGTFWVPAHAKGSKEHGEIAHEYEVNPEEEL